MAKKKKPKTLSAKSMRKTGRPRKVRATKAQVRDLSPRKGDLAGGGQSGGGMLGTFGSVVKKPS